MFTILLSDNGIRVHGLFETEQELREYATAAKFPNYVVLPIEEKRNLSEEVRVDANSLRDVVHEIAMKKEFCSPLFSVDFDDALELFIDIVQEKINRGHAFNRKELAQLLSDLHEEDTETFFPYRERETVMNRLERFIQDVVQNNTTETTSA